MAENNYGIKVGSKVAYPKDSDTYTVIGLSIVDRNRVFVKSNTTGEESSLVAEWCEKVDA
jgi:hypothetical protein